MGLLQLEEGRYRNAPVSASYLIPGKPEYLGGYADMILGTWDDWKELPQVVSSGVPLHRHENATQDNDFWINLVPALAPLSFPPARFAAERLAVATMPEYRMLDVGGGAGPWSVVWLGTNPRGHCDQLDLPNVNEVARRYVGSLVEQPNFDVIDGNMEETDLGEARYDHVIYCNVAHGLSAERNLSMFRRIHAALRPGGTLVISGLMPYEDRTGHPLLLMFNMNMILNTRLGATHLISDYRNWLAEAGFSRVTHQRLDSLPFTLIFASP